MKIIMILFCLIVSVNQLTAKEDSTYTFDMNKYEMKTYYMVFLKSGPNRSQDSTEAMKIQIAHLNNIQKMANEGKLAIAGPFLDNTELRGIFILNVESIEEAEKLVSEDPAVKAGRLTYEIHPWMSAKGSTLP